MVLSFAILKKVSPKKLVSWIIMNALAVWGATQARGETCAPGNMNLDMLINMFAGLETRGFAAPNNSNVPPEELYATQLAQLQEMGFFDVRENLLALIATAEFFNIDGSICCYHAS
nr:hypothetical protein [Tanacetum cinerariifolium]